MTIYTTLSNIFTAVANLIRKATGSEDKITPNDFEIGLSNIQVAKEVVEKTITKYDFKNSETISAYCFYDCKNLNDVKCENTVSIATNAFAHCSNLKEIDLPETLTLIESRAFDTSGLEGTLTLPNSLAILKGGVFNKCQSLETVVFGSDLNENSSISEIGEQCFMDCKNLSTLVLTSAEPPSLKSINAFKNTPISTDSSAVIYVLDELVSAYENSETNWNEFAGKFKPISEFNQEVNNNDITN